MERAFLVDIPTMDLKQRCPRELSVNTISSLFEEKKRKKEKQREKEKEGLLLFVAFCYNVSVINVAVIRINCYLNMNSKSFFNRLTLRPPKS